MTKAFVLSLAVLVTACAEPRPTALPPQTGGSSRIVVERVGIISDGTAYGNERGLYVITDTKTGVEYIGVSGIGICETGAHGKHRTQDER